jgi:hydrogenase maturation protease
MSTRILIAAAGNVFMGDDGFGPRVIQKLGAERLPDGVKSVDFGVRGMQLLYELSNGWDAAILVDTVARGGAPGTLYVLEPGDFPAAAVDGHDMHPARALSLMETVGTPPKKVRVVGCEPEHVPTDELAFGLSAPVENAVSDAVQLVRTLAEEMSREVTHA